MKWGRIGRLYFPFTFLFETIKGLDKIGHQKPAVNIGLFIDEGKLVNLRQTLRTRIL
jgi:hypothetical protein